MQGSFKYTIMGILVMIMPFLSCSSHHNLTSNPQQMKEFRLSNAEIQKIDSHDQTDEIVYQLSFMYERKLRDAIFYYHQHSGTLRESHPKEKCQVLLTRKHHELPRSVYPLLTQGYIVVQFSWLGMETYQVIKDFKKPNA
jgi:hypothetical protein